MMHCQSHIAQKQLGINLLSRAMHDLIVRATDNFPQVMLRGVRHDQIACRIRVKVAFLRVRLGERQLRA